MVKTYYETKDGKRFDDTADAYAHEAFFENRGSLKSDLREAVRKTAGLSTDKEEEALVNMLAENAVDFYRAYQRHSTVDVEDEEDPKLVPRRFRR